MPTDTAVRETNRPLTVVALLLGLFLGAVWGLAGLIGPVQSGVPWKRCGVATASTMFSRSIGGTLSVGVLGGFAASLFFPAVPIAPRGEKSDDGLPGGRQSLPYSKPR